MPRPPVAPRFGLGATMQNRRSDRLGEEVAAALGMNLGNYYRPERGTHAPSYPTAVKLAARLGWTTDEVMAAAARPAEADSFVHRR